MELKVPKRHVFKPKFIHCYGSTGFGVSYDRGELAVSYK